MSYAEEKKWGKQDLNLRPAGYESAALTTELLPLERVIRRMRSVENIANLLLKSNTKN